MNRIATTIFVSLVLVAGVTSLELDEAELEAVRDADIEFENYVGPVERVESSEAIRGIGRALGREVGENTAANYDDRYRAVRIVGDPDDPRRAADIVSLEEGARVDHIDNVRRIVSGYLEVAWAYSRPDSDLLARFVTIYNAVHRGALEFFAERYRDAVIAALDPPKIGISTSYRDWAGATQLVIPVRPDGVPGRLDAVDPGQLVDELVILELRRRSDLGIEDRKAIIDFIERVIEERTEVIAEEREEIEAEREEIEQREQQIEAEIAQLEEERDAPPPPDDDPLPDTEGEAGTPPPDPAETTDPDSSDPPPADPDPPVDEDDPEEQIAALESERQDLEERRETLEEREDALEQAEEEVQQLEERVEELYEETAADQESLEDSADVARSVPFVRTARDGSLDLVLVDPRAAAIVGDQTVPLAENVVAAFQGALVAAHRSSERLLLLDRGSLDVLAESDVRVVAGARILAVDSAVLTLIEEGGETYIGEFDASLVLVRRSARSVSPETDIAHLDGVVVVQRPSGAIDVLSMEDL